MGWLAPLLYAVPYGLRARALARRGRPLPAWRLACAAGAIAAALVAFSPPVGRLADRRMAWHMVEHLLLGDVAPLLAVLACTGPLLAPVLRVRRLRALGHPLVALPLWAGGLVAWHLHGAYDATLRSGALHVAEHATFAVTGFLLWMALLGPLPKPAWFGHAARMAYVALAWLVGSVLGGALVFAGRPLYAAYPSVGDQSAAGALMMVEQGVLAIVLLCWLFSDAWRAAGERQELAEVAATRGVALDGARAARAVEAGQAARLRARLLDGPSGGGPGGVPEVRG